MQICVTKLFVFRSWDLEKSKQNKENARTHAYVYAHCMYAQHLRLFLLHGTLRLNIV